MYQFVITSKLSIDRWMNKNNNMTYIYIHIHPLSNAKIVSGANYWRLRTVTLFIPNVSPREHVPNRSQRWCHKWGGKPTIPLVFYYMSYYMFSFSVIFGVCNLDSLPCFLYPFLDFSTACNCWDIQEFIAAFFLILTSQFWCILHLNSYFMAIYPTYPIFDCFRLFHFCHWTSKPSMVESIVSSL